MEETSIQIAIPIITLIVSVISSVVISTRRNKVEMHKVQVEFEQKYAKSLFDKRIEYYRELYELLSNYGKTLLYKKQNVENLSKFRISLDEWNNKYSIFFTNATARISSKFRRYSNSLLSYSQDESIKVDDWVTIRKILGFYEKSLRSEIGIYDTKPVGEFEAIDKVYEFIDKRVKSRDPLN